MAGEGSFDEGHEGEIDDRLVVNGFVVGEEDPVKAADARKRMTAATLHNESVLPVASRGLTAQLREETRANSIEAAQKDRSTNLHQLFDIEQSTVGKPKKEVRKSRLQGIIDWLNEK